ncbi:STAS domain-containing protein [Cryptosporangium minutisporangium]|uniref:STAS domain-containing protein n=1 Tax=Cryptosporangium minutisporangium TaxID=113569 RepID=A0ABP6SRF6_9ACTN
MLTDTVETVLDNGPDPRLTVTVRGPAVGTAGRVVPSGELTRDTGQVFVEAVRTALRYGYRDVRVDLGEVSFVDARGLAVCLVAVRMAAEEGCALDFENAGPMLARVLALGGLTARTAGD